MGRVVVRAPGGEGQTRRFVPLLALTLTLGATLGAISIVWPRACASPHTNRSLPSRVAMIEDYVKEYRADGFLVHSVKSCNSFSAGQLTILREVERRTGVPGAFIESDLVDPRYFSAANLKNRLESYFQMLDARRVGATA